MSCSRPALICCLLVGLVATPAIAQTPTPATPAPAPGVSAGQKIGNIVKAAITTASPALGPLMDLIWQHLSNPASTSAKKTDLAAAATAPATQAAANQKSQGDAQKVLQPVSAVADELAVIVRFLGPSVTASQDIIVIQTVASATTPDWTVISNNWELAKIQIGNLKSVQDADLNKVRDLYLRDRLSLIRAANDTTVVSVGQDVSQKNLTGLQTHIGTLQSTLANMTAIAGYEFAELQADLGDLAKWAQGTAGGATSVPARGVYKTFLDANVRSSGGR